MYYSPFYFLKWLLFAPLLTTNITKEYFLVLDPTLKVFVSVVAIVGPACVVALILFLKRIEKDSPERIRWK